MALRQREACILLYPSSSHHVCGTYAETPKQILFPCHYLSHPQFQYPWPSSAHFHQKLPCMSLRFHHHTLECRTCLQMSWAFSLSTSVLYVSGTNGTKQIHFLQVLYKPKLIPNTSLTSFVGVHAKVHAQLSSFHPKAIWTFFTHMNFFLKVLKFCLSGTRISLISQGG